MRTNNGTAQLVVPVASSSLRRRRRLQQAAHHRPRHGLLWRGQSEQVHHYWWQSRTARGGNRDARLRVKRRAAGVSTRRTRPVVHPSPPHAPSLARTSARLRATPTRTCVPPPMRPTMRKREGRGDREREHVRRARRARHTQPFLSLPPPHARAALPSTPAFLSLPPHPTHLAQTKRLGHVGARRPRAHMLMFGRFIRQAHGHAQTVAATVSTNVQPCQPVRTRGIATGIVLHTGAHGTAV